MDRQSSKEWELCHSVGCQNLYHTLCYEHGICEVCVQTKPHLSRPLQSSSTQPIVGELASHDDVPKLTNDTPTKPPRECDREGASRRLEVLSSELLEEEVTESIAEVFRSNGSMEEAKVLQHVRLSGLNVDMGIVSDVLQKLQRLDCLLVRNGMVYRIC
jgi:hypothetical protein